MDISKKTLERSIQSNDEVMEFYEKNRQFLSPIGKARYKELQDAIRELEAALKELEAKK